MLFLEAYRTVRQSWVTICRGVSITNLGLLLAIQLCSSLPFAFFTCQQASTLCKYIPCVHLRRAGGREAGGWRLLAPLSHHLQVGDIFLLAMTLLWPKTREKILFRKHVSFLSMLNLNSYGRFLKICAFETALIIHVCFITKKRTNCKVIKFLLG